MLQAANKDRLNNLALKELSNQHSFHRNVALAKPEDGGLFSSVKPVPSVPSDVQHAMNVVQTVEADAVRELNVRKEISRTLSPSDTTRPT